MGQTVSSAFLAISDKNSTFIFFSKWPLVAKKGQI
jgi:hypothetical protein